MGKEGQEQPEARALTAGAISARNRSVALSSLYVIVRLTKAAKGKGSVAGEFPSTGIKNTVEIMNLLVPHTIILMQMLSSTPRTLVNEMNESRKL